MGLSFDGKGKIGLKYINKSIICIIFILFLVLMKSQLHTLHTFSQEDSEFSKVIYVVDSNLTDKLITHVDTGGKKMAALTFDDGPDPLYTPDVLEILKKYQIKATFFVVGENAEAYPELVRQEIKAGHEIENHTYTHPDLSRESELKTGEEIQRTEQIIDKITDIKAKFFRPPKKLFRRETIAVAEAKGYKTILWSICVENSHAATPSQMAQRVIDTAHPGMIILAHDGRLDRRQTIAALPMIIEAFQQQGYQFVTLDELLNAQVKD